MAVVGQQLVNGLTLGGVYALIALGYSMVYGVLTMLNFAHGEVFMLGAFAGWLALQWSSSAGLLSASPGLALAAALLAAVVASALAGLLVERFAYRPLRDASRLAPLISALGVSIFLQNSVMLIFGARAKIYPVGQLLPQELAITLWGMHLSLARLLVLVMAVAGLLFLDRIVYRSSLGQAMRAVAQDMGAAELIGLPVNRIVAMVFFLGSAMAGLGGVLVGIYYTQIGFAMGFSAGMKGFTAAVLGGIGNLRGAMLGGLVLGIAESAGAAFISPVYKDAISLVVLVAALLIRPHGILGEELPDKA